MCGAVGTLIALDKYVKSPKNLDKLNAIADKAVKNSKSISKASVLLGCGLMAYSVGVIYLGSVIGKFVDKKQNEKTEACKQELSLLKDAHYLY
jgi:hypothetical protein